MTVKLNNVDMNILYYVHSKNYMALGNCIEFNRQNSQNDTEPNEKMGEWKTQQQQQQFFTQMENRSNSPIENCVG